MRLRSSYCREGTENAPGNCTILEIIDIKVVLTIRIALGVVLPLRMSLMGRHVLRDHDLLRVVVSKRHM